MAVHRCWSTARVEADADEPGPRFTLRVGLTGTTADEWRAAFSAGANVRTSLGEPWGQVEVQLNEIVVHDLRPERESNFLALLYGRLTQAVVRADRRTPLPAERMTEKNYDAALDVGADQTWGADQRARELTDRFRAQS